MTPEDPTVPDPGLAVRLLEVLGGLDLTSADGRAGIGSLLSEIERLAPGAIHRQAAGIDLQRLGWSRSTSEAPRTHRPRARLKLRPVGPRHDLPQDGLPGAGHLLGAAAWSERGCGDDVRCFV